MTIPAMMKSALVAIPLVAGLALSAVADTVLNRSFAVAPTTLDPHKATNALEIALLRDLFEGLTAYGPDGKVQSGVATVWSVSPDGLSWIFRLGDAHWSNGDPVTGADFVRAFRRLVDPATESPHAWRLAAVDNAAAIGAGKAKPEELGVDSPSPRHVRFTLSRPEPILPVLLADPAASPLHAAAVTGEGRLATAVNTNGAFNLSTWVRGEPLQLTRNARFRAADSVALDAVRYQTVASNDAAAEQFKAGKLQAVDGVPIYRLGKIREEFGDRVRVAPYIGTYFLALNLRDGALAAPLTRQALALAVDRAALAAGPWGGTMVPAVSLVPAGLAGGEAVASSSMSVAAGLRESMAQSLLEAGGFGADKPLKLTFKIGPSEIEKAAAEAVAKSWATIGISTEIVAEDSKTFRGNLARGRFEVAGIGWIGDYADPTTFLAMLAGDNEALNFSGYENPDYDALLAEAGTTNAPDDRAALLVRAQQLLARDMPVIPLLHYASASLVAAEVDGWEDNILNIHPSRWLSLKTAATGEVTGATETPAPAETAK